MADPFSTERANMASGSHLEIVSNGDSVALRGNEMYVKVRDGAAATSLTLPPAASSPLGLRITLDNAGGSGTLSINSGELTVPAAELRIATCVTTSAGGREWQSIGASSGAGEVTQAELDALAALVTTAQAEVDALEIVVDAIDSASTSTIARTGTELGLVYAHDSYTTITGAANVTALNAWSANTGPKSWTSDRLPLAFEGRVAMAGATAGGWTLPIIDGVKFFTNGMGTIRAESEYTVINPDTNSYQIGITTGFVWVDHSNLTGPMLTLPGYGGDLGHLRLDGNFSASTYDDLVADTTNRKAIGLLLHDQQEGYGVGKYHFASLTPNCCLVGMKVTAAASATQTLQEQNSDECTIDHFKPEFCDIGFLSQHTQCLGMHFGYCTQFNTPVMWKYEKGGDLHADYLFATGASALYGLHLTMNNTTGSGVMSLDHVQLDAQCSDTYQVIHIEPDSGTSAINTTINYLKNESARATGAMLYIKNNYGLHVVGGGEFLPSGMVYVEGGVLTLFPTVIIQNCKFINGADLNEIRNLFPTTARGHVQVAFVNNTEDNGLNSPVNAGEFYRGFVGLINIDGNTTYQLLSGGYLPNAFQSAAYTVTNGTTDRTYDANATTTDELADVLATLIVDLKSAGILT